MTKNASDRYLAWRPEFLATALELVMPVVEFDALKVYYLVILGTQDVRDVTPFQGFSTSWRQVEWALRMIALLPADVLEKSSEIDDIIAQRMGGFRSLSWSPLSISSLESVSAEQLGAFLVVFSGEELCAKRVAAWQDQQTHPILHISSIEVKGRCDPAIFELKTLQSHCVAILEKCPTLFSEEQRAAAEDALSKWAEPAETPSGLKAHRHNVTHPNYMALRRAARSLEEGKPFIGRSEKEYTDLIIETAEAVIKVREDIRIRPFHNLTLLRPDIILAR